MATAKSKAPNDSDQSLTYLDISSDRIGKGDDELGALLMRGFIGTLIEASPLPGKLILMNGGVRLAIEDSASLPILRSSKSSASRSSPAAHAWIFIKSRKSKLSDGFQISCMWMDTSSDFLNSLVFSVGASWFAFAARRTALGTRSHSRHLDRPLWVYLEWPRRTWRNRPGGWSPGPRTRAGKTDEQT